MRYGLLAVVVLFYLIGPSITVRGLFLQDIIFVVYLLGFVLFQHPFGRRRDRQRPLVKDWRLGKASSLAIFGLPALVATISIAGKVVMGNTLSFDDFSGLVKMWNLAAIAYVAYRTVILSDEGTFYQGIQGLLRVLLFGVIGVSVLGLLQYFVPWKLGFVQTLYLRALPQDSHIRDNFALAALIGRPSSVFRSQLEFGLFLAYAIMMLLVNRKLVSTAMMLLAIPLGFCALVISNARAGLILALLTMPIVVWRSKTDRLRVIVIMVVLSVVSIIVMRYLSQNAVDRLIELLNYILSGFDKQYAPLNWFDRRLNFSYVLQKATFSKYLFFGYPQRIYDSEVALSASNIYLVWLVRYGFFGVGMVIWQVVVLGYFWKPFVRSRSAVERELFLSMILVIVYSIIAGQSQDSVFLQRWREFFFALLGMLVGWLHLRVDKSPSQSFQPVSKRSMAKPDSEE